MVSLLDNNMTECEDLPSWELLAVVSSVKKQGKGQSALKR